MQLIEDNRRELEIDQIKNGWESLELGRAKKAEELRLRYLREMTSMPTETVATRINETNAELLTPQKTLEREKRIREQLDIYRQQREAALNMKSLMADDRSDTKTSITHMAHQLTADHTRNLALATHVRLVFPSMYADFSSEDPNVLRAG